MELDLDAIFRPGTARPSGWRRMPTVLSSCMVSTSHPLATRAGVRALEAGGNAVDAALAAAAVLTVAEPTDNGPGGDAFALIWDGERLHGMNGSGRAPLAPDAPYADPTGPRSVTVPGAVRAWADASDRFGRLGLDEVLSPAADLALAGLAITARISDKWGRAAYAPFPAPRVGERYSLPDLGRTLAAVATHGPEAFYHGDIARAIAASCWLSEEDLAAHVTDWVEPLRRDYRGVTVCELPPNGQGAAALLALALYDGLEPGLHSEIEAMKLALSDTRAVVHDGPLPADFFDESRLAARRSLVRADQAIDPPPYALPRGGTTYIATMDAEGMAVSWIQSIFHSFGSGVFVPGTGIALQNRAAGFSRDEGSPNLLAPGKRPYHTIIPGFLLEEGRLLGPFGVMGGPMQPQGHFQVVRRMVDEGLDPQGALDAPRWRVEEGREVDLEPGLWGELERLRGLGHDVTRPEVEHAFGVGQVILRVGDVLVGGSDGRGDGHAAGF